MEAPEPVRHRAVFFIPGFDPIGARRYRELYRTQGAEQADISGYSLDVKGCRAGDGPYHWRASLTDGVEESRADIFFLGWTDLIRAAMTDSILLAYGQMLRTAWIYLSSGALTRLIRLRPIPMIIALYPIFMLSLYFNIAFWAGVLVHWWSPPIIDYVTGTATFLLAIRLLHRFDQRNLYAFYLMSDYAFAARERGRMPVALAERVNAWAALVRERGASADEVLIVGHSSGAALAVHLAVALKGWRPLSVLTLGHVVPMVSFLPTAGDLRRDLHALSQREDVYWLDVTAPSDGACFALADPVAVSGVAVEDAANPVVISGTFLRHMSKEQVRQHKRRYFRKHVQYLCAFGRPGIYDYFQITAGSQSLRARFGGRGSTASRIATPLSPHQDMDPCP
ncbi:hypothetical protein [Pontivivens insulae]|uniref:Fungal lipase-like domain-containing protein n=1 Tax=Pontivivens insulae TaxID=1639689 RepID=A0A2R8AC42_9RHOB|nr:hypothetical protein [Pontivivens insulae]RED13742.1 hypothetical protein DFR53_1084 [Pontivivens insulae]SPF29816.1 hypothetical protein POI8812_02137 [Pontivivens insulae]